MALLKGQQKLQRAKLIAVAIQNAIGAQQMTVEDVSESTAQQAYVASQKIYVEQHQYTMHPNDKDWWERGPKVEEA